MSATVIIFILIAVLNTFVILLDILVIWAAIKTRALYRNRILYIITTAMLMDIAFYMIFIVHDVPSFALERDFTCPVFTYVSLFVIIVQWFTQLFSLLFLSTVYFFAVFSSKGFRTISLKYVKIVNCSIIMLGLLLSIPFLTKYCGYKYYVQGHYWYFDFEKPHTYIYAKLNVALQGLCVATVIAADTAIMWKVIQMRSNATIRNPLSVVPGGQSMRLTCGREARLALNFVMLSMCFLIMTISYNVILGDGMWQDIITRFTLLLNLAKLAIYALETPVIRYEIINLFGCCKRIGVYA